jgi:transcriptional regulator with PAS, ATPase and Fis domain
MFSAHFRLGGEIAKSGTATGKGTGTRSMSINHPEQVSGEGQMDADYHTESLRVRVQHAARQVESRIIREVLEQHHWNRRRTAAALKISYRSLMYKMKTCNLRDASPIAEGKD